MIKTPFLLWCDTETSGLDHRRDTILEAAWFVTDRDGTMLTPVRSRLCAIQYDGEPVTPEEGGFWDVERPAIARIPEVVRTMHQESGLVAAHAAAQAAGTVIESPVILEQMMVDTLRYAHSTADVGTLSRLAGDGVGHFEREQFGVHFPRLVNSAGTALLHYRPVDTSHALEVFTRGGLNIGDVITLASHGGPLSDVNAISFAPYPEFEGATAEGVIDQVCDTEGKVPHRAAADVLRAWLAYREISPMGGGMWADLRDAACDHVLGNGS